MNSQSKLYREATQEELTRITATAFPRETLLRYHLLSGGLFNTTYRIITDRHDAVLRLGPVHRELLLPYEHNLMAAEALTDRLCLEHGIPASQVLHLDTSKTIIDRDFMIVDRIESIPLSDPAIPEDQHPAIQRECGRLTRKLHAITGTQFGRLSNIAAGKGHNCWYDAIAAEFSDVFAKGAEFEVFDHDLEARSVSFVSARKEALKAVAIPHLAHCDLWAGNVLVREEEGSYQIRAIIDGDRAIFGDEDMDLATPWITTEAFLAGYGAAAEPTDEATKRRQVYSLLLTLQDAYIWKVEYGRPDICEENLRNAEALLDQ